jgi:hypothetical protein
MIWLSFEFRLENLVCFRIAGGDFSIDFGRWVTTRRIGVVIEGSCGTLGLWTKLSLFVLTDEKFKLLTLTSLASRFVIESLGCWSLPDERLAVDPVRQYFMKALYENIVLSKFFKLMD